MYPKVADDLIKFQLRKLQWGAHGSQLCRWEKMCCNMHRNLSYCFILEAPRQFLHISWHSLLPELRVEAFFSSFFALFFLLPSHHFPRSNCNEIFPQFSSNLPTNFFSFYHPTQHGWISWFYFGCQIGFLLPWRSTTWHCRNVGFFYECFIIE